MFRLLAVWRALVEGLLNFAGLLNVAAAVRPKPHRKRIAFQAYSAHLAQCFAPIVAKLQKDLPDIDVHFIVLPHPHFPFRSLGPLKNFVHEYLKIPRTNIRYFWQVLWQRYDVLVCTDVYARFPMRMTRKVLLKHGAGVASRILTPHPLRKTIYDFDLVLVNGEADYDVLCRYCTEDFIADRVVAAGLPYLDRLQTYTETRASYLRRLGHTRDEKVALIAPSWRGLQIIQEFDPGYFGELIKALRDLGWQVIIKMHACSFNKGMVQGDDWEQKLLAYVGPGIRVDDDIDDVPALQHADLLITDISSRAFNFVLLDKPVIAVMPEHIFTDRLDLERIRLIEQSVFIARSPAEIQLIIKNGLNGNDRFRAQRQRLAERVFSNPGHATEVVVHHLLRHMGSG